MGKRVKLGHLLIACATLLVALAILQPRDSVVLKIFLQTPSDEPPCIPCLKAQLLAESELRGESSDTTRSTDELSSTANTTTSTHVVSSMRPQTIEDIMASDRGSASILVGVSTTVCSQRRHYIANTWASAPDVQAVAFHGRSDNEALPQCNQPSTGVPVLRVAANDNVYPSYRKHWMVFEELFRIEGFDWYVWCDPDAFVFPHRLRERLNAFNASEKLYLGQLGYGRASERKLLRLGGNFTFKSYVLGSTCAVVSSAGAKAMLNQWSSCRNLTQSLQLSKDRLHHDVELGRCASHVGMRAEELGSGSPLVSVTWLKGMKYTSPRPCDLKRVLSQVGSKAVVMHPIKDPFVYLALGKPTIRDMLPDTCGCTFSALNVQVRTSCNGNNFADNDKCSYKETPVCPITVHKYTANIRRSYVISMSRSKGEQAAAKLPPMFHAQRVAAVNGWDKSIGVAHGKLKPGETGYRLSMQRALEEALNARLEVFAIFDDDVMVSMDYSAMWRSLKQSSRCYHDTLSRGGALMLGFTEYRTDAWAAVERSGELEHSQCIDAHTQTLGSFAVIYTAKIARAILQWLRVTDGLKPFDHVWTDMVELGFPVRGCWPPLIIARLTGSSSVDPSRDSAHTVDGLMSLYRWGNVTTFV